MRFWDTSALIRVVLDEEETSRALMLMGEDLNVVISFVTLVEITSALARRHATDDQRREAMELLASLEYVWTVIDDYDNIIRLARRLALSHTLRSGDAFQLAAAVLIGGHERAIPFRHTGQGAGRRRPRRRLPRPSLNFPSPAPVTLPRNARQAS